MKHKQILKYILSFPWPVKHKLNQLEMNINFRIFSCKVLKRLLLSSKQWSPKHQQAEEEYNNGINSCVFPQVFPRMPSPSIARQPRKELEVRRQTTAMCYHLLPKGKQCAPWDNRARGNSRGRTQVWIKWKERALEQWLKENRSCNGTRLGVLGWKRKELVRNAAYERESVKDIRKNSNAQLGNTI